MVKWWASREKRMLRAERNPPDHFPQWISMHGRAQEHEDWQHVCVENIWEYLVSHLDFPFFGMSRAPRSLADTLTENDANLKMAQNTCKWQRLPVDLELQYYEDKSYMQTSSILISRRPIYKAVWLCHFLFASLLTASLFVKVSISHSRPVAHGACLGPGH